jgi:hypothetical protein
MVSAAWAWSARKSAGTWLVKGDGTGAGLHVVDGDRVTEGVQCLAEGVADAGERARGTDENQPQDAARVGHGDLLRDVATARGAHHDGRWDIQGVEEFDEVLGRLVGRVALGGLVTAADSSLIGRHKSEARREARCQPVEAPMRLTPGVDEESWDACTRFADSQLEPGGELHPSHHHDRSRLRTPLVRRVPAPAGPSPSGSHRPMLRGQRTASAILTV